MRIFTVPKITSRVGLVRKWGIFCTGNREATNPVQKRVSSGTKTCLPGKMVHKSGISCTGSTGIPNPVRKRMSFDTKTCLPRKLVHKWGIFCTGSRCREWSSWKTAYRRSKSWCDRKEMLYLCGLICREQAR